MDYITDEHGLTALHWAASYGQLNSCQDLVWCGANVNMRGPEGETALHLAAAGGHHEVVKFLLNEGADADIQDDGYLTIVVYYHYFSPGSLKLHTHVHFLSTESFEQVFGTWQEPQGTRRWLPLKEAPYPGYCRAPFSAACVPALCNCEKLTQIWKRVHGKKRG